MSQSSESFFKLFIEKVINQLIAFFWESGGGGGHGDISMKGYWKIPKF